jgi:hypothetical protein
LRLSFIGAFNPDEPMFQSLGYTCVTVPPIIVFILEALEATIRITVPVLVLAGLFPLGMFVLVIYFLTYKEGSSINHYLEFARGAQSATYLVSFVSFVVAFLPVFFGESSVGLGLISVSVGSMLLPGLSSAGALGISLSKADETMVHGSKGTTPFGSSYLCLAFFLGAKDYFRRRPRARTVIIGAWVLLVLGWLSLSSAGGFPATLIGLSTAVIAPIGSYWLFIKRVNPDERSRLKDILNSEPRP